MNKLSERKKRFLVAFAVSMIAVVVYFFFVDESSAAIRLVCIIMETILIFLALIYFIWAFFSNTKKSNMLEGEDDSNFKKDIKNFFQILYALLCFVIGIFIFAGSGNFSLVLPIIILIGIVTYISGEIMIKANPRMKWITRLFVILIAIMYIKFPKNFTSCSDFGCRDYSCNGIPLFGVDMVSCEFGDLKKLSQQPQSAVTFAPSVQTPIVAAPRQTETQEKVNIEDIFNKLSAYYENHATYRGFVMSELQKNPVSMGDCVTMTKVSIAPDGQSFVIYRPSCETALTQSLCEERSNDGIGHIAGVTIVNTNLVEKTYHCE